MKNIKTLLLIVSEFPLEIANNQAAAVEPAPRPSLILFGHVMVHISNSAAVLGQ